MAPAYSFVATMGLVELCGAWARAWWNNLPAPIEIPAASYRSVLFYRRLYALYVVMMSGTAPASFVLAIGSSIRPRPYGTVMLMGAGVFLSFGVPLFIARIPGRDCFEGYWRFLEGRSRLRRRVLTRWWLGTAATLMSAAASIRLAVQ